MDQIRVFRLIEYVGDRDAVEAQIKNSLHGTKSGKGNCQITGTTLGEFPEELKENMYIATCEKCLYLIPYYSREFKKEKRRCEKTYWHGSYDEDYKPKDKSEDYQWDCKGFVDISLSKGK